MSLVQISEIHVYMLLYFIDAKVFGLYGVRNVIALKGQ